MRKKIGWLIMGCLCLSLISYGAFGFANNEASAELSQQAKGAFLRVEDSGKKLVVSMDGSGKEATYPVSTAVWVYRNMQKSALEQLKPGDKLDMILNSKDQVAYIKAATLEVSQNSEQQDSAAASAQGQAEPPQLNASLNEGVAVTKAAGETGSVPPTVATASGALGSAVGGSNASSDKSGGTKTEPASVNRSQGTPGISKAPAWEKLSFEWKSRELALQAKQEPSDTSKGKSELYVKMNDRSVIHLEGDAAAAMIQTLLMGLPTDKGAFEQALKQRIAAQYQLKDVKPEWKLDVKWKESLGAVPVVAPAQSDHPGKAIGQEKDKSNSKDKEKDKSKDKDKEEGRSKGKEKDKSAHKED